MAIETLILLGVGVYMLIMIGIGIYASRGSKSLADFALAGRNLPLWLCSVSIFATWFGSGTMMGAATAAYEGDRLLMLAEPFGSAVALLIAGLFFARIMRRTRRLTWPELIQSRFGRLAGTISSAADLLASTIWLGGILFTFGVLLESLTGAPMSVGIIGGLLVVVVYTMIGGMWAVAITDFIQMLIFLTGMFVLLGAVLYQAGGWGAIVAELPDHSFRAIPLRHTAMEWIDTIHIFMGMGLAGIASSSVIQRAMSARTEGVARHSFLIAAFLYATVGLVPLMLGYSARILLPDLADPNAVLTDLAIAYLHPVLTAVFIGAILSAIMSSSDSILLGSSTIISTNLLPLVKTHPDEQLRLRVARYSIPVVAAVSTYVAFNANRVVEVLIDSVAVLLAAVIVPFIACFWWNKANRSGALASMVMGVVSWRIAAAMHMEFPPDLFGFCVSAIFMVVVSLATQKQDPPRPLTDIDEYEIELTNQI
jgi:SSS family transporter